MGYIGDRISLTFKQCKNAAIALQTQVANHAAHISEGEMIAKLVSEGIIPESALVDIQNLVEMESRQI